MLLARTLLILFTAVVAIIYYGPVGHADYAGRWGDGTYGIGATRLVTPTVEEVRPGSPAERAGVRPGDVLQAKSLSEYTTIVNPVTGERNTFTFQRPGGEAYQVTLTATPVPGFTTWDRITGILAVIPVTVFLAIAFLLVFLRPNVMTWSFYAYAIGYGSTGPAYAYFHHVLSPQWFLVMTFICSTFLGNFAVMPLLPFLVRFPDDKLTGIRQYIDRCVWALMGLAFVAYSYEWYCFWSWTSGRTAPGTAILDNYLPLAVFGFATIMLFKKVRHASPALRQRFGFLTIGLVISFVAYAAYFVPMVPFWLAQIIGYAVVIMPISVAYAVLRHRVLDVNFVLNRALAYGVLSIFVIALVSLLDWMFSRVVSERHLAVAAELGVTICIGFLLDRINKVIEALVERVFFRSRRAAENYVKRVAAALPYATDEAAVSEGLTQVPGDALRLRAAALYHRSEDGTKFEGIATSLQTPVAPPGFDGNHLLVRMLQSGEQRVWLEELRSTLDPANAGDYVLAIPVSVRHELVSFTLYGAHQNGAQLDPEEIVLLEELAHEAARAYDHIDAVRTRERYAQFMTPAVTVSQ
jgi:hypothetical protein